MVVHLGVAVVDMVVVIAMDMMAMIEVMVISMKAMVEDMVPETVTVTEVMGTITMMTIMEVVVVVDMAMIVTAKAQGVVLPVVDVVHPAEVDAVVVSKEEEVIEGEEDQAREVAPLPVVEEVALHPVVDPEVVVLLQQKGSMVQTRSRHLWSTLSQSAGSWGRISQVVGEANQSPSSHCTIVENMAIKDPTKSGTAIVIGSSGNPSEEKFWLAVDSDLATYSTAFSLFVLALSFEMTEFGINHVTSYLADC